MRGLENLLYTASCNCDWVGTAEARTSCLCGHARVFLFARTVQINLGTAIRVHGLMLPSRYLQDGAVFVRQFLAIVAYCSRTLLDVIVFRLSTTK